MLRLLASLIGLSSLPALAGDAPAEFGSAFYTGLSISVVQVRVANTAGKSFFGSGVVVAENEVITNCHVTRQAARIEVAKGALVYPVFGQKADMNNDLCLLRTATDAAARGGTAGIVVGAGGRKDPSITVTRAGSRRSLRRAGWPQRIRTKAAR
jgi:S1-C subfamily serine protease